jgi:hypothetical protein
VLSTPRSATGNAVSPAGAAVAQPASGPSPHTSLSAVHS